MQTSTPNDYVMDEEAKIIFHLRSVLTTAVDRALQQGDENISRGGTENNRGQFMALVDSALEASYVQVPKQNHEPSFDWLKKSSDQRRRVIQMEAAARKVATQAPAEEPPQVEKY